MSGGKIAAELAEAIEAARRSGHLTQAEGHFEFQLTPAEYAALSYAEHVTVDRDGSRVRDKVLYREGASLSVSVSPERP